jgi:phosphoribosylglycinamide formyltransferase 1
MRRLRVVVLVSGSGRTLQNFIDLSRTGELPVEIALVIGSKPGLMGLQRAVAAHIPIAVVERKAFDSVAAFSEAIFRLADGAAADLVLLAGWLHLLTIPTLHNGRVLNIHPALLPKYGGKGMWGHHVHEAVLAAGERESGCTVHLVNNEYDAGPVLLQRRCPVLPGDTADTLAERVFEEEKKAYPEVIRSFAKEVG